MQTNCPESPAQTGKQKRRQRGRVGSFPYL